MAKQDKITELFRANAHKLEQKPSEATWARLQHRLQQQEGHSTEGRGSQRPQGLRVRLSSLHIAAGLALLIGLSAAFLWVLNEQDRQYQQALASAEHKLEIEDLAIESKAAPSPIVKPNLQQAYRPAQKTIEEGTPEQKLVARVSKSAPSGPRLTPTASDSADANGRMGR
ncbi:MAG: hypothetical protein D6772_14650 [Bacteroidetes bacterium]|nr:MAG: hypothetical protein D6772_14650 [Bacteroidota bacterium]